MRFFEYERTPAALFTRTSGAVALMWACVIVVLTGSGRIASLEGIDVPWVHTRMTLLGGAAALGAALGGLTVLGLAAHGVKRLLAWGAVLGEVVLVRVLLVGPPPPSSVPLAVLAAVAGTILAVALCGWLVLHVGPRTTSGARFRRWHEARQVGTALFVFSALVVAAVRTGLLHRLHRTSSVDAVVFTPVLLVCLALTVLLWHRSSRALSPLEPTDRPLVREATADRTRATRVPESSQIAPVRLADVVLPESARAEIQALIRLLTDPASGHRLGVAAPAGAIFYGPPGTGKTLIARALAGETNRTVLAYSGAELTSMWAGESVQLVRRMFQAARAAAPCVLFIDELDGLTPSRGSAQDGASSGAGHDLRARLGEFLQQFEGVGGELGSVFVVGSTNRLNDIDRAVRSRLAYHVEIPLPDEAARAAILRRYLPPQSGVAATEVARLTNGFAGRQLRDLCRVAGIQAMAAGDEMVSAEHVTRALERVREQPGAHATRPADPSPIEPAAFDDLVLPLPMLAELRTLVRLVADPAAGAALGVVAPAGAIFFGPPGTGKTLIARAVAGESHRPVLAFSGASLTSPWTGDGVQLVRDAFRQARAAAPCILFLDELDGLAPSRYGGPLEIGAVGHDAAQRINQVLQELEGVSGAPAGVFVIGATNVLDAVDSAVRSRLSFQLGVPLPDAAARAALLRQHFPRCAETTPEAVVAITDGLSGRDLRELCRIAGLVALSEGACAVSMVHFSRARERLAVISEDR